MMRALFVVMACLFLTTAALTQVPGNGPYVQVVNARKRATDPADVRIMLVGENLPDGTIVPVGSQADKIFVWQVVTGIDMAKTQWFLSRADSDHGIMTMADRVRVTPDQRPGAMMASFPLFFMDPPVPNGESTATFKLVDVKNNPVFPSLKGVWIKVRAVKGGDKKPGDNAEVRVEMPTIATVGRRVTARVTITNTGTTVWQPNTFHHYLLGIGEGRYKSTPPPLWVEDPASPQNDEGNRVTLPSYVNVHPGGKLTYEVVFAAPKAPTLPGKPLIFVSRMLIEGGKASGWPDGWFGQAWVTYLTVEP